MTKRQITLKPDLIGRTPGTRVPVYIRPGSSDELGGVLAAAHSVRHVALVTDTHVGRLHSQRVRKRLTSTGWTVDDYELAPGERIKTELVIRKLHEAWLKAGYDRSTPVIALGGGTVGDAVGFAAATFMRGLPLWQLPTTVVGQVDSAIGGKVGINHPLGKNLIGCFQQPSGIVIDPNFLTTLPIREIRSGLAEVVKYGIIADSKLFRRCEESVSSWVEGTTYIGSETIKPCVAIKLNVVRSDEHDTGRRHILNFGHTLGHAFEAWGDFKLLRHGEAVTLGMVAASQIANRRGMLSARDFGRISSICGVISPSKRAGRFESEDVIPYLGTDKKRTAGRNVWVLPSRIGAVTVVSDVTDKEIRAAIEYTRQWLNSTT